MFIKTKLRVLDLSEDIYSPEQLGRLTQQILMHSPAFTSLKLTTTFLTAQHIEAMLPYLSCPQLKRVSLNGNDHYLNGDNEVFQSLVNKLLSDCPQIQFIDVSGNHSIKADSVAAKAFDRLVTINRQVFVRIPQDKAVYEKSMRNHYEYFIPNQFVLMDIEVQQIRSQLEQFGMLSELINTVRAHEERFTRIDAHIQTLSAQFEETNAIVTQAIRTQCLKQILLERQMHIVQTDMSEFKASMKRLETSIHATQVYLSDMESRVEEVSVESVDIKTNILGLKRNLAKQADMLDSIDERVEEELSSMRGLFDNLAQKIQSQWTELCSKLHIDEDDSDLGPAEQAYVKKFKYMLVQMYIVSMVACEGSLQLGSTGAAGTTATILDILSSAAPDPISGVTLSIFTYLLQAADEHMAKQRMDRITHLGSSPDEVTHMAKHLSRRLLHCLTVDHYVKKGVLQKLMSVTTEIMQSFAQDGFYGALFHAAQDNGVLMPLTNAINQVFTIPELEKRAEQDVQLLLTAIVKEDVPQKGGHPDIHRLFLYTAPVLTLSDHLFLMLLQQFCVSTHCDLNQVTTKLDKRQKFYGCIAKSWHDHAEEVALKIEAEDKMSFIQDLVTGFTEREHADRTTGFFYFKTAHTIFSAGQRLHASIRNQALEPETVAAVLNKVLIGL